MLKYTIKHAILLGILLIKQAKVYYKHGIKHAKVRYKTCYEVCYKTC